LSINDVQKVAIVGAGLMGHGIALEFSLAGYQVRLNDLTDDALEKAITRIHESLRMLQEHGVLRPGQAETMCENVQPTASLEATVSDAEFVIESIAENLEQKQAVFGQLDALCPAHAILATNSSSFMPSQLASATKRPERVLGTHYFNPPFLIPLVEIIRGPKTADATVQAVHDLMKEVGKSPVIVQKEVPGFIGNRIQAAIWREILSLVAGGVASPQEIDQVVKTSIGRRWSVAGPFEITELAGLDLKRSVLRELLPSLASGSEIPAILNDRVERGELGVKTGKGFYDWAPGEARSLRGRIARALVEIGRWK